MRPMRYNPKTAPWLPWEQHEAERLAFAEQWLLQEQLRLARKGQSPNSRLRRWMRRLQSDRRVLLACLRRDAEEQRRRAPEFERVRIAYREAMRQWNRSAEARELRANDRIAKAYGF